MASDLEGQVVVVEGLDPSETPLISPPHKSRWNGGDSVSTSKLGMMLSNMQNRLVDLDEKVEEVQDSPDTTVEGNEPGLLESTPSTETQDNSRPITSSSNTATTTTTNQSANAKSKVVGRPSTGGATKPSATATAAPSSRTATGTQRSSSSTMITPGRKPTTSLTASPSTGGTPSTTNVRVIGSRPSQLGLVTTPAPKTPTMSSSSVSSRHQTNQVQTPSATKTSSTPTGSTMRRSLSSAAPSTSKPTAAAPVQSLGRKSLSTSTPTSSTATATSSMGGRPSMGGANTATLSSGSVIKKKMSESSDGDSVMSGYSRSTTNSKIPSRSSTPNKTASSAVTQQRQSLAQTPPTNSSTSANTASRASASSKFTPSPKAYPSIKTLSGSFSDSSVNGGTPSRNGISSGRTPVKAPIPKFTATESSKSLARKTSFGSVGSMNSATASVTSTMSSASKVRRSTGGSTPLASKQPVPSTSSSSSAMKIKPQKSIDELDEIYSTDNVVSSLKAQKIPSAQLLRTTIQRIDTAAIPHTLNPLRRGSLTQSPSMNNSGNNLNNSFTSVSRRDSKSEMMDRSFTNNPSNSKSSSSAKVDEGNFGMDDIKVVEADDDVAEDDCSPHPSHNGSLQDLQPLGRPPSSSNVLGVKPSPLVTPRANPFAHRKSYMMSQTPDDSTSTMGQILQAAALEYDAQNNNNNNSNNQRSNNHSHYNPHDDDGEDLLSMFVNSTDINDHDPPAQQYPSPPAPMLSTRSKSSSLRFRDSPRKSTFPPPYTAKQLYPLPTQNNNNTNNSSSNGDLKNERAMYMPPLVHSTPAAISAIYRAAVAKEASSSQTMLGRIASFRK